MSARGQMNHAWSRSTASTSLSVPTANELRLAKIADLEKQLGALQKQLKDCAPGYRIWLERGDRPGSPEEDWLKAESEVRAKYTRPTSLQDSQSD